MKKAVLIDGNNLLFRSYYATAYRGSILRNSSGFPTNALYGFINMLNKIVKEDKPSYMMIAFDKGKTFRHDKYIDYKAGRIAMPDELREQFPVAKEIACAMGIPCFEIDNYEADDIIGTFAKEVDIDDDFIATIVSSDKDLLQLISNDVEVKLLKSSDYIMMDEKKFFDEYGISPDKIVDLKALMGDSSDNIPGVKGVGEKTALSLLQKYGSLDLIYENIDEITGKTKEKLLLDKDNAYFSYELATIYKDVPIDKDLNKIKYNGITKEYIELLKKYEFFSLLDKVDKSLINEKEEKELEYVIVQDLDTLKLDDDVALYLEVNGNYHDLKIVGLALYNDKISAFVPGEYLKNSSIFTSKRSKYTYDLKRLVTIFKYLDIKYTSSYDDLMIMSYLLNYNVKTDISSLMNICGVPSVEVDKLVKSKASEEEIILETIKKAKFIYDFKNKFKEEIVSSSSNDLYKDIELPLVYVLSDMEYTGVNISRDILNDMKDEIKIKLDIISHEIYNLAGCEFNILSPKQLGKILFEKLSIPYPKKIKDDNYSTSVEILNKLLDYPIIDKILDYRTLAKLYSNYAVGLQDYIKSDGKIHTNFNQTLTRTGRLSSNNPNLQNIPIREDYGRLIRKAFIPSDNNVILSCDYSQMELRIFAHMSGADNLISAFKEDLDIHTKTAMDIFNVPIEGVTSSLRRNAKAVNFGILYGISSFGLSEDLGITPKEAKKFMDHYLETYPGIKSFMDKLISDAYEKGYVSTMFGRTRVIDELKNSNYMIRSMGERMALNTPIQGTEADILKKAMIMIYNEFNNKGIKSKMIIQVHDELVFDCLEEELDLVIKIVKKIMENVIDLKVPLKVDINYGNNWYEAK